MKDDWEMAVQTTYEEHTDFISSIICTPAGRVFSCGFDGFICAYGEQSPRTQHENIRTWGKVPEIWE